MKVTQVSAGMYHSCALTASGQLYTWGNNSKGQLGLGRNSDMVFSPSLVESLTGVPVAGVTCGGNHTLVVTRSGAVYAWGSNNHGQLGLGKEINKELLTTSDADRIGNLHVYILNKIFYLCSQHRQRQLDVYYTSRPLLFVDSAHIN